MKALFPTTDANGKPREIKPSLREFEAMLSAEEKVGAQIEMNFEFSKHAETELVLRKSREQWQKKSYTSRSKS